MVAQIIDEQATWSSLDWSQLYDNDPKRNAERRHWAKEVLKYIQQGENVALDADTGTGKAIMAILVHLALKKNTLWLVPTVELAYQHRDAYKKLTGTGEKSLVLTGNKTPLKRAALWQDTNINLVFATPQTIMSDLRRGIFPKGRFKLLVVDEFHHAHYNHAYVPITKRAHQVNDVRILSLSAWADDPLAIKNCFVTKIVKADVSMPRKIIAKQVAKPSPALIEVDRYCQELLAVTTDELAHWHLIPEKASWLTNQQLVEAEKTAKNLPWPDNRQALSAIGRWREISYLRYLLNMCSYKNFLDAAEAIYLKSEAYANWLVNHQLFNDLVCKVRHLIEVGEEHPKVAALLELAKQCAADKSTFIIFVNEKDTGRYLAAELTQKGLRVDIAFGGKERKHMKEVRAAIENNLLDGVVASSYLAEGVALSRVDVVIHYGRALTRVEWKQRIGRAGRGFHPGKSIAVLINWPQEWAREKKVQPPVKKKPRLWRSNNLWLFPPEALSPQQRSEEDE